MTTDITRRKLSEIDFSEAGAHIALVGPLVGGPANQQETVLWKSKSTKDITDQQVASEIALIEKAKFNSEVRSKLSDALDSKFASRYEWLYLEDFSEDEVVFQADAGMFIVGYSLSSDDNYSFDDVARGFSYELIRVENGQVKLSEEAQSKLSEGEYVLVNKALNNPETNSRVVKALADFTEKKENMETEIQKAVAAQVAENDALRTELDTLKAIVKAAEAEKKANILKSREAEVSAVLKEGAVELVKSTESLSDESFAEIVKALNAQKAVIEKSDLMTEMNDPEANTGGPAEVNTTMEIIKARYPTKA